MISANRASRNQPQKHSNKCKFQWSNLTEFCALLIIKNMATHTLTAAVYLTKLFSLNESFHMIFQLSKFLYCMQERGLIIVQEASKGVDHITAIAWDHPE